MSLKRENLWRRCHEDLMRAEALVTLAAPRGVDFLYVAGSRTESKSKSKVRSTLSTSVDLTPASGRETRTQVKAEWTVAEIGQAAAGVAPIPFMVACYSMAGERTHYWRLYDALLRVALRARYRNSWSWRVPALGGQQRPYLETLAQLVLDEDANQAAFKAGAELYAVYAGVDPGVWNNKLSARYDVVKSAWLAWFNQAMYIIQPRLANEDDCEES